MPIALFLAFLAALAACHLALISDLLTAVVVLALLVVLVATEPDTPGFQAVRRRRGVHLPPPPIQPLTP